MESETIWDLSWKRPQNLPYPKVWHRFEAISRKTGCKYKIKIQDIPEDRFKEAIDFNEAYHERMEPMYRALKITEDADSVIAMRTLRWQLLEQRISLMAAIDEGDDAHSKSEMIGTLVLSVKSKNDPPTKQGGKQLNKLFDLFAHLWRGFDPFQLLESDCYISHFGLTVAPKYYGLGIGLELELQSQALGKACDISGSAILFTNMYSQPFWKKVGATLLKDVRYDEFKNESGEVIIPNVVGSPVAELVLWKYK